MSKVYSFRLDTNNPREIQAREVIEAWISKGYSLRYIITEAFLQFYVESEHVRYENEDKTADIFKRLNDLVDRLEINLTNYQPSISQDGQELQVTFMSGIEKAARPGMHAE